MIQTLAHHSTVDLTPVLVHLAIAAAGGYAGFLLGRAWDRPADPRRGSCGPGPAIDSASDSRPEQHSQPPATSDHHG